MRTRRLWMSVVVALGACFTLAAQPRCDADALEAAKLEFREMRKLRQLNPGMVSEAEFRALSNYYVSLSQDCYHSMNGHHPLEGLKIDDGGMRMKGVQPRHVLTTTKWGAGSPFAGGADAIGPRLPGGERTYSYMATGVDLGAEAGGLTNTSIFDFVFTDSGGDTEQARCLQREIGDAFGAWSEVADIRFRPVADNGVAFDAAGASGDIRIGFHPFDGPFGVLAHGFVPPPNGVSAAGDIHFDSAEPWACTNESGSLDFGIVALHEIGHAIGLDHEPAAGDLAVMNPSYNPALNFGPVADDIIGAGELYGEGGAAQTTFFGSVGIGTDDPGSAGGGVFNASLHVRRTDGTGAVLVENDSATKATRTMFELVNNGDSRFSLFDTSTGEQWLFIGQGSNDRFLITNANSGVIDFRVNAGGDTIIAGSLTTAASFVPDYVFEEDYPLLSLDDLGQFVFKNKHLPNIPSSAEVQGSGQINMTDMQMKLLEKIEELTLYTLQQHDRIQTLEQERVSHNVLVEQLLARVQELEAQLRGRTPQAP